jgi:hypothetical protein
MKFLLPLLLGMLILAQSCTGQNPAPIKNSTTARRAIKSSCSSMKFEGQLLSKKNILNIFDCSGWAKLYPELNRTLLSVDENAFDDTFKVFNESFFTTKERRKAFYEVVAASESRGELKSLSRILEKSLSEHKLLTQVDNLLNVEKLGTKNRSNILKIISKSNEQNLLALKAFKNVLLSYEFSKPILNSLLSTKEKSELPAKVELIINDLSLKMDSRSWNHLSGVVYNEDSAIQKWAIEGASGDLRVLLDIIEEPDFKHDVTFLQKSLHTGITCGNGASSKAFTVNVGQELKHKIEGLKLGSQENFEDLLLHGLTKFLAFQEFCEEKTAKQGLKSFQMVLRHAFNVIPSKHDFNFLKNIHQIFGDDRFVFLSFLSSDSFSALQSILLELKETGRDEQLVRSLYEVLAGLTEEDLAEVSKVINEIATDKSQSNKWINSWSEAWGNLSRLDKEKLIKLLSLLLSEEIKGSNALSVVEVVLAKFPDLSEKIYDLISEEKFQENVMNLVEFFSDDGVQNELSAFFSKDGLFEVIEIMTQEYNGEVVSKSSPPIPERVHATYVESLHLTELSQTRACFENLTLKYNLDTSYYNLVNTLPEPCLNVLGRVGFVGKIYLWMNSSDSYFRTTYGVNDFHSGTGVWSPGMLQFLFSAGIKADLSIQNSLGTRGILNNVDEIHRVATDPLLLEMFHQFSNVYSVFNQTLGFEARLLNYVSTHTDSDFNSLATHSFKILRSNTTPIIINARKTSCSDINDKLGAMPCLSSDELSKSTLKIFRVLKRKNEQGGSLIKSLVKWLHPEGGIEIPFQKPNSKSYKASLEETIHFLFDLSSKKTIKSFEYQSEDAVQKVEGSVIDRVEVVIRDISFQNNFFGAYFKNMVSSASNYKKDVSGSEKLLKALDNSSGIMRRFNALPDTSKYKLKNVRATFSSLIEIADKYPQTDGSYRSYDGYIQSLLAAVTESSKIKTQSFNAYRVPNEDLVNGHNGEFLTEVVKLSGLRHLSSFIRSHFDEKLSALNTLEFKKINSQLIARHELVKIQNALQMVLDKYLDNDRDQLNVLINDAIYFISNLSDSEKKDLEELMVKGLLLLSDERLSNVNIESVTSLIEVLIQSWPEVREIFIGIDSKSDILRLLNKMMTGVSTNPESLNIIISNMISFNLFSSEDLKLLLKTQNLRKSAVDFLNQVGRMDELTSELNWIETFETIFASPDMRWEPLSNWLNVALGQQNKKLTLSLMISFLGEKHNNQYRLKLIMDELFLNHRVQLNQFLAETFKSLELKPD